MGTIFCNLLKTSIEKMSIFRLSTILMKINELDMHFHDVAENKGRKPDDASSAAAYNDRWDEFFFDHPVENEGCRSDSNVIPEREL